jgi:hypothetical protein
MVEVIMKAVLILVSILVTGFIFFGPRGVAAAGILALLALAVLLVHNSFLQMKSRNKKEEYMAKIFEQMNKNLKNKK